MRRPLLAILLVVAGLEGAYAADNEITVVAGIDYGFKRLRLDTGGGGDPLESNFVTLNPNVGVSYKSFYSTFSYDRSIHAEPDISNSGGGAASVLDFDRSEYTFTVGYRINASLSAFGGYTRGANEFTETSTGTVMGNTVLTVSEITYTEQGPFIGLAYNEPFDDRGTLGLSLGYARLDSELDFLRHPSGSTAGSTKGDNTGLSYGVTWSGPMSGSLSYRLGLKSTRYEMNGNLGIVERYTSFFFGISNFF